MKNNNVSDFIASTMYSILNSDSHKSLFNTQYKFASTSTEKDEDCVDDSDSNSSWDNEDDISYLDSNYALPLPPDATKASGIGQVSKPVNVQGPKQQGAMNADDDFSNLYLADDDMIDDSSLSSSAGYNIAIDSLLTASAALDSVGVTEGSALALKLASIIIEAKKKAPGKKIPAKKVPGKKMSTKKAPGKKLPFKKDNSGSGLNSGSSASSGAKSSNKKVEDKKISKSKS